MSILKLIPSFKSYLWGGQKLQRDFGKQYDGDILAESWELSCHPDGPCCIANGEYAGKTLQEYIDSKGTEVLGSYCRRFSDFPILIKLIDAKDNLSIQVHPDNQYALKHEGQFGKTEMWYIVDCEEDAFLYYGFQKEISKEEFRERIEQDTLLEVLHAVPVKKGDVFFIEAGTLHAIGKGIVIAEIQQNSNVTYRIYDYGRRDADGRQRELHIDRALDVTSRGPVVQKNHARKPATESMPVAEGTPVVEGMPVVEGTPVVEGVRIAECEYFIVEQYHLEKAHTLQGTAGQGSFTSLLILNGQGRLVNGSEYMEFGKGDSLFLPAGSGSFTVSGACEFLLTTIGPKKDAVRVGVDIGGTNVKLGLVNQENELIASKAITTQISLAPEEIIQDIAEAVLALLQENNIPMDSCLGVGIGCAGTIDSKAGVVVYSNNIGWENVAFIQEFQKYIALPAAIENDADCAAVGEWKAGSGRNCENLILLTLGTGLGGGIICDGKLYHGGVPGGAEIGHILLERGGRLCTCGRRGCAEAYVSATALRKEGIRAAKEHPESLLNQLCGGDHEAISAKIVFDASNAGDPAAGEVVKDYIQYLGEVVTDVTNLFRPEKILLGGGVCEQGPVLIEPLKKYALENAFGGSRIRIPEINKAVLGNHAGIIGAANLI